MIIIALVVIALLLLITFTIMGFRTAGMSERDIARELAKVQLDVYKKIKKSKPHLQGEELYRAILNTRMNVSTDRIEKILKEAHDLTNKEQHVPLDLRFVTLALAISEFEKIRPYPLTMWKKIDMLDEIIKVIPKGV